MIRYRARLPYFVLVVLFLAAIMFLSVQYGEPVAAQSEPQRIAQATLPPATAEPTIPPPPTATPLPPAEIPEPITVILFGTGLAALSAAAARRKKAE